MERDSNECTDGLAPNEYRWDEPDILKAIEGTCGVMTQIAKNLGCTRQTARRYVLGERTTDAILAAYNEECEAGIDLAESVVYGSMKNIETMADKKEAGMNARWYLGMKGAKRGYVSKTETAITEIPPIKIVSPGVDEDEDFLPE